MKPTIANGQAYINYKPIRIFHPLVGQASDIWRTAESLKGVSGRYLIVLMRFRIHPIINPVFSRHRNSGGRLFLGYSLKHKVFQKFLPSRITPSGLQFVQEPFFKGGQWEYRNFAAYVSRQSFEGESRRFVPVSLPIMNRRVADLAEFRNIFPRQAFSQSPVPDLLSCKLHCSARIKRKIAKRKVFLAKVCESRYYQLEICESRTMTTFDPDKHLCKSDQDRLLDTAEAVGLTADDLIELAVKRTLFSETPPLMQSTRFVDEVPTDETEGER